LTVAFWKILYDRVPFHQHNKIGEMFLQKGSYTHTHHCEGQIPVQTSAPQICPTVLSRVHLLWPCDLEKAPVAVKTSAVIRVI